MEQREITEELVLLDENGALTRSGWARSPLWTYNRTAIKDVFSRVVERDRYIIFSDMVVLVFEIVNLGRMLYASVQVSNLVQGATFYDDYRISVPIGMFELPASSTSGTIRIKQRNCAIDFSIMEKGSRIIKVDIPAFYEGTGLRGVIVLTPFENSESIVTVNPWRRDKRAFRYNLRKPTFMAEGVIQFGNETLIFNQDNGWASLDWTRGSYPRGEVHYLAIASGSSGGRKVACSIGYGMEDNSSGSENAFFLDNKLYKLGQVTFRISPRDWLAPWYFSSDDKRLSMEFQPILEHKIKRSLLFQSLKERRVFGYISGTFFEDSGSSYGFHHVPAFAERQKTKL